MRWNDPSEWIFSTEVAHEPLVSPEQFARAQEIARAGMRRPITKRRSSTRSYVLSGLMFCGVCGRRMHGACVHERSYYRCLFPREYALTKEIDHPLSVYVREEAVVPELDRWLAQVFNPRNVDSTIEALTEAAHQAQPEAARLDAARKVLADCDGRLARYRATLEAGGDPKVVAAWIAEVQGERLHAEREIARHSAHAPLDAKAIRALVRAVRDPVRMLRKADPALKARIYSELGLRLEYRPAEGAVMVEAMPVTSYTEGRVGEET
ncbi:MAG: recombinase zinc beta ribbon domain-containing protein [Actinomycetota bacterium]